MHHSTNKVHRILHLLVVCTVWQKRINIVSVLMLFKLKFTINDNWITRRCFAPANSYLLVLCWWRWRYLRSDIGPSPRWRHICDAGAVPSPWVLLPIRSAMQMPRPTPSSQVDTPPNAKRWTVCDPAQIRRDFARNFTRVAQHTLCHATTRWSNNLWWAWTAQLMDCSRPGGEGWLLPWSWKLMPEQKVKVENLFKKVFLISNCWLTFFRFFFAFQEKFISHKSTYQL